MRQLESSVSSLEASFGQRHAEAADQAVTYQVEPKTQRGRKVDKSGATEEYIPCEPDQSHYGDNKKYDFRVGELYRIWQRFNSEVHLSTFLVMAIDGTSMTCLKLEHRDPDEMDLGRFETRHVKLKVEQHIPGTYKHQRSSSRLRTQKQVEEDDDSTDCVVYMAPKQCLRPDCFVEVSSPWNINWKSNYLFVYCGRLSDESFKNVVDIHLTRYSSDLRKHLD